MSATQDNERICSAHVICEKCGLLEIIHWSLNGREWQSWDNSIHSTFTVKKVDIHSKGVDKTSIWRSWGSIIMNK